MKKFSMFDAAALLVWLLPLIYLLTVYATLPAIVPLHYGFDGKADGFGTKDKFLLLQLFLAVMAAGSYFLLKYLPLIDPKKQVKIGEPTFKKIALGLIIFLSALSLAITFGTVNNSIKPDKLILPIIGLLFTFLGNVMYSVKPNYFVGVRTPWTLENEDNWRATHRLAGKVWFGGGIIITIMVLLLPGKSAIVVFTPCVVIMSLIPIIYSYIYFKKHPVK